MSVVGGAFSAGRVFRGGAQSSRPSSYYMGFWPCQQADGDTDDEQVTDRSGNGAHAVLNSLTSGEAWNTAGYLESLAAQGHSAGIPVASWTHRFSTGSLILAAYQRLVKGGSAFRVFGNGIGAAANGFNVVVTTLGGLQIHMAHQTNASLFSSSTSGVIPYDTDTLHSWLVGYNLSDRSWTIYVDGAITVVAADQTIAAADVLACDSAVASGPAIGGRPPASAAAITAVKTKMVHALSLPGLDLPSNLAVLAQRLHVHPRLMLRDSDLVW